MTEVWKVVLGAAVVDWAATEEDAEEAALSLDSSPEQTVTVMTASAGQACMP